MNCFFQQHPDGYCRCTRKGCTNKIKSNNCERCHAKCKAVPDPLNFCKHLHEPTGDTIRVFDCGCPADKENGFETAIFACDLHQLCVLRGDPRNNSVARCDKCPDLTRI